MKGQSYNFILGQNPGYVGVAEGHKCPVIQDYQQS